MKSAHALRSLARSRRMVAPLASALLLIAPVARPQAPQAPPPDEAPTEHNAPTPPAARPAFSPASPPIGGTWIGQGPGPTRGGQVENIQPNNEVIGAVHAVLPHPTDPNVLYVGGVNGGVWRTRNATAASPAWTPLTDHLQSLSIGALAFDLTDLTFNTVVAGVGRFSSFGQSGGSRTGLQRTTDSGDTWTEIDGGGLLRGKNISGVIARGSVLVVSVNTADNSAIGNVGIFRSVNGGASFTQISTGNGSSTGLPGGAANDLVGDPGNLNVLYTSLTRADTVGGVNGIYKSTNQGATWTRVSNPAIEALILTGTTSNIELAAGTNGTVYVGVLNFGQLAGLFRSGDGGATWTQMDTPVTNENGTDVGINPRPKGEGEPGGQGSIHFSIAADPTNPNLVYVGGDRQPRTFGDTGGFPNSIGANDFSGRLFRGDASQPQGSQWVHLTHSSTLGAAGGGTANRSSPHADSRDMAFDALGRIIESDDGGVYRRTSPRNNAGDWFSIIGNLRVTEFHDIAYDANSDVLAGGAQDTGTPRQIAPGNTPWQTVSTADGGDVAIDVLSAPGFSVQYSSFQNLGAFRRRTYNAANQLINEVFPARTLIGGGAFVPQFVTPVEINVIDPVRLILGGADSVHESFDQGNTIEEVSLPNGVNRNALAYGGWRAGVPNTEIIYAGSDNAVHVRTNFGGALAATPAPFPGGNVADLALDPDDWATAWVIDSDQVFRTVNAGASWTEVTGNLVGFGTLRCVNFVHLAGTGAAVVGTDRGVFLAFRSTPSSWEPLGAGLPNAPVYDLDYSRAEGVLVAGLLGRGGFKLQLGGVLGEPDILVLDASGQETAGGSVLFSVNLTFAHTNPVTVRYATADGSARAGVDYVAQAGSLSFEPGQTAQTVTIPLLDDLVAEPVKYFFLNLADATNAVIVDKQGAAVLQDNDNPPVVAIVSPTNGAALPAGADASLTASAYDPDGTVSQVAFYRNGAFLGAAGSSPFTVTWPGPVAGTYTLTAVATDNSGLSTTSAPVSVLVAPGLGQEFALIRFTDSWRYDATTNDYGPGWKDTGYPDGGWQGPSPGVFHNEPAALPQPKNTVLPLTFNGERIRGFYFRTHFHFPTNPGVGVVLTASNLIDDGAVFYLNGAEVGRLRVTNAAPVPRTALASATPPFNGDATNYETLTFSTNDLVQGDNVLAVEVHQQSDSSSDVVFGMSLDARLGFAPILVDPTQPTNRTVLQNRPTTLVVLASGSPAPTYRWYQNGLITGATTPTLTFSSMSLALAGNYFCVVSNTFGVVTSRTAVVAYLADTEAPLLLSAVGNTNPATVTLAFSERLQTISVTNVANYQIVPAEGGPALTILAATLNNNTNIIVTTSARAPGVNYWITINGVRDFFTNALAPNTQALLVSDLRLLAGNGQVWSYFQSNTDPGAGWQAPGFCDTVTPWSNGPALFDAVRPAGRTVVGPNNEPVRTMLNLTNPPLAPEITRAYYFRTVFQLPGPPAGTRLFLRPFVDDGAAFYLNGAEVLRLRMPAAPAPLSYVTFATLSRGDTENVYEAAIELPAGSLVEGENVFAAEVHQANAGSSDMSFAAQLTALLPAYTEAPRLHIARDGAQVSLSWSNVNAILECAGEVTGSWTNVMPMATSPHPVAPDTARKFFRLRLP